MLRLIYIAQWRNCPTFAHPIIDEAYLDRWARAIAAGEPFGGGAYFRAPFYPLLLAAIYKLFGPGYLCPRIVQAVLGSASCGLVFLIGRAAFGRTVAVIAGVAAASYWTLIFYDGELLAASLSVFLALLLIWLLQAAARRPPPVTCGLAGLALGLSAITRPDVLLFGPAIIIWLAIRFRGQWRRFVRYSVFVTAGCLIPILPVTIRNYVVGRDFVLIAWQGGLNFYIGNNPLSDGRTAVAPGMVLDPHGTYQEAIAFAERATGRPLKPSEVSSYFYGLGWKFIRENPGRAAALTWLKARLFWNSWEIANNKNMYFWAPRFAPLIRFLPLGFAVVGPLGLLGLVLCRRRAAELFPLWGSVLVYMAAVVPFFCSDRFRLPIVPILILLAAYAVVAAIGAVRAARWKVVAGGAIVLGLGAVLVNCPLTWQVGGVTMPYTQAGVDDDFTSMVTLGDVYDDLGRPDLSLPEYTHALAVSPGYVPAARGLGESLLKLNRLPEGIDPLRQCLQLNAGQRDPQLAAVHSLLASALALTSTYPEAMAHYQAAIDLNPTGAQGADQFNLALLLAATGCRDEARAAWQQAVAINPDFREKYTLLKPYLGE